MVVNYHGWQGSAYPPLGINDALADREGFLALYPQVAQPSARTPACAETLKIELIYRELGTVFGTCCIRD